MSETTLMHKKSDSLASSLVCHDLGIFKESQRPVELIDVVFQTLLLTMAPK